LLELSGEGLQASAQRGARSAMRVLLLVIGEASDDQIATEAGRRLGPMQLVPGQPQLRCRSLDQCGDFGFDFCKAGGSRSIVWLDAAIMNWRWLATVSASRSLIGMRFHAPGGEPMRYTRPRSSWAEARVSPSFFFRVPEKSPRTVCRCQPVALATSSTVAPSGRCSIAITASCFDGGFASGG